MSWNTSRILNNLEYEINENKQDISMLEQKTLYISDQLSLNGTVFVNNVYSDAFIINGVLPENKGYLMSDGTITTNIQQGQPNIYLYTNSNGVPSNDPQSGQVRFINVSNTSATHVYISDTTSDSVDICILAQISNISILYLQDKNSLVNWVRYPVQGIVI